MEAGVEHARRCAAAQIFIVSSEKIKLRGYETLYTYSISNPKSSLARFVASVAPQWQVCRRCSRWRQSITLLDI